MRIRTYNRHELQEQGFDLGEVAEALIEGYSQLNFAAEYSIKGSYIHINKVRRIRRKGEGGVTPFLRPVDWLAVFDATNSILDKFGVEAIADTSIYRFRIGQHHRIVFDDEIKRASSLFDFRHKPEHQFGNPKDYAPAETTSLVKTTGMDLAQMVRVGLQD